MPQKILIVRFSSIGDIVLTTPVIRCVREQTGAEVHFLTKAAFGNILRHNPYVHKVWTIKRELSEINAALRVEKFDVVLDLHNNLRTRQLRLHLRSPKYYRFAKLNWQKWLLTRWKINRMPEVHIVERYLATARTLGVNNDQQGLDYFLPEEECAAATRALTGKPYLAFVIGAAHPTKCLTETQKIDFCRAYGGRILLLGGPAEQEEVERIANAAGAAVVNTCGHFKLHESAYLVKRAAAVLTHDTGLMHIAAAFGKPIVSIWGNTVPDFGMYPYLPGHEPEERKQRVETAGLNCRPCSKIGHAACPRGHFRCIKEIATADILAKVQLILN